MWVRPSLFPALSVHSPPCSQSSPFTVLPVHSPLFSQSSLFPVLTVHCPPHSQSSLLTVLPIHCPLWFQLDGASRCAALGRSVAFISPSFLQINTEDLEDDLVVNGERSDCTLPDSVSSGNKGRAKHGNAETKQDGGATKAGSSEQV